VAAYVLHRLLLMIPTLLGVVTLSFVIVQFVPGGPVDRAIAQLQGHSAGTTAALPGGAGGDIAPQGAAGAEGAYRGARGLDPAFIKELEALYGFDKPPLERYLAMLWNYARFDLGESYYKKQSVASLVVEKLPVSITLGLWTTLLVYLIAVPLGIAKAVRNGTPFDFWTSLAVFVGYAVPAFLFAIVLMVLFAGGRYFDLFPLRGIVSDGWRDMGPVELALDYLWHITLPVAALVSGGFAALTILTKNAFLDELGKPYVLTARAKGVGRGGVLWGHVFRNAMLIVIAGFPAAFIASFFTGSLLVEYIFSLDGLGLLAYEAAIGRDYPVVLGVVYIYALIAVGTKLLTDLCYVAVDPRIHFGRQT
jgi:microcin C transport system permease protein